MALHTPIRCLARAESVPAGDVKEVLQKAELDDVWEVRIKNGQALADRREQHDGERPRGGRLRRSEEELPQLGEAGFLGDGIHATSPLTPGPGARKPPTAARPAIASVSWRSAWQTPPVQTPLAQSPATMQVSPVAHLGSQAVVEAPTQTMISLPSMYGSGAHSQTFPP